MLCLDCLNGTSWFGVYSVIRVVTPSRVADGLNQFNFSSLDVQLWTSSVWVMSANSLGLRTDWIATAAKILTNLASSSEQLQLVLIG